jgi:glycosyltransferase involved in cell wall biosynthesis
MVTVDVYVMVHNEEFILPYFLRHYGAFARQIIAFEDQSTDRSREILEAHPAVRVIEPEQHGINEKYWTGTLWPMYEKISRGKVDYVMQVDADEFVYHPDLLRILEYERAQGIQEIHCRGYTMVAEQMPSTTGQIYDEIRRGLPDRLSSKWAVFDPMIHLRYGDGRHKVRESSAIRADGKSGLKLLHYRYLGSRYFEERDQRNRKRFNIHDGIETEYNPQRKHNLPDGSRGAKLDWYAAHRGEAVEVI